jgi:hypothetical protein
MIYYILSYIYYIIYIFNLLFIFINFKLTDTDIERTLRVPKMRGSQFNSKPFHFIINSDGIKIIKYEDNKYNNSDNAQHNNNDDKLLSRALNNDNNSLFKTFR